MQRILNNGNTKTVKGEKEGFKTFGIHLAPSKLSGYNVCKWASEGCSDACLNISGHGQRESVQIARIKKTKSFFENKEAFMVQLIEEIEKAINHAIKKNLKPCFRLNLTSDLPWENIRYKKRFNLFELFPDCQFYDYTKSPERMSKFLAGDMPSNYHLTFSRSETKKNRLLCPSFLKAGGNVAVVFRNALPKKWKGFKVVDGDRHDLRFLEAKGIVIGLIEKGLAKKDETGFVVG